VRRLDEAYARHLARRARSRVAYEWRFGSVGDGTWIGRPLLLANVGQATLGNHTFIRDGARVEVVNRPGLPPGSLTIGNEVGIEQGVHIVAAESVVIEDQVTLAPRVMILDCSHPVGSDADGPRHASLSPDSSPVLIQRRAFLGANVVVLPGTTIGRNSIVGANSVVTTDIPPDCVAVGAPAKVVRRFDQGDADPRTDPT
jgi:acetyltransferase-like isoleucine patch superfamily enzyme